MVQVIESIKNKPVLEIVQDSSVEDLIKAKAIGERIRKQRLQRSMGLVELGSLAGLSASFLSQLETGRVHPTLRNLARLSAVFKCDLSYFFQVKTADPFRISRGKDRFRLVLNPRNSFSVISENMNTLITDGRLAPVISELLPGSDSAILEPALFLGQEFLYLMSGSIMITTTQQVQLLEQGDVVWMDGKAFRQYKCMGGASAKMLTVSMPHLAGNDQGFTRHLSLAPAKRTQVEPTVA